MSVQKFKPGVKVRTSRPGRTSYHTEPACHIYPERPVRVTENELERRDLTECQHCKRVRDDD